MPTEREQVRKIFEEGGQPLDIFVTEDVAAAHPGLDTFFDIKPLDPFDEPVLKKAVHPQDVRQSAFYATALSQQDPVATNEAIKRELEVEGVSGTLDSITNMLAGEQDTARKQAVEQIILDPNTSEEEKALAIQGYLFLKDQDVDLQKSYVEALAVEDNAATEEEALQQDIVVDSLDVYLESQRSIQQMVNSALARQDASTGGALADFVGLLAPFVEGIDIRQIAGEVGVETSLWDNIFVGSAKKDIHNALLSVPIEQRDLFAEKLITAVEEHTGTIDKNGMATFYHLGDLVSEGIPDWQVWVDNAVGLLDVIGLGAAAKAGVRGLRGVAKTKQPLSELEVTMVNNPRSGSDVAAAAILDDTGRAAESLGTTRQDVVVDYVLPIPEGSSLKGAPASVVKHMEEIEEVGKKVLRNSEESNPLLYTATERQASRLEAWKHLRNLSGVKQHLNKSSYNYKTDGSFSINSVFGKDDVSGFLNKDEAVIQAERIFGEGDYQVLTRDMATNTLRPATENDVRGDFYIQHNYQDRYNPMSVSALGVDGLPAMPTMGRAAKYAASPATRFQEIVRAAPLQAVDLGAGFERDILHGITKTLADLGKGSQKKVFEAVEVGAQEEKRFSFNDLKARFDMSDREATAYLSFMRSQDFLWMATNREVYRQLRRDGFKSVYAPEQENKLFGREVSESTALNKFQSPDFKAYDLSSDTAVRLTSDEVAELYSRQGQIIELKGGLYDKHNKYNFAIVDPAQGMKVGALSKSPLNYIEGYYQRLYEDPYFVVKTFKGGKTDGKTTGTTETLANVSSIHEAKEIVQRLHTNNAEEGVDYSFRRGREHGEWRDQDFESIRARGLLSTRKRSDQLRGYEDTAKVKDPLRSYENTARAVSNKLALGETVEVLERRFMKDFPEFVVNGKIPTDAKAIKSVGAVDPQLTGAAIQRLEHIQTIKNLPGKFDDAYRNWLFNMSEVFDSNILGKKAVNFFDERQNPLQFGRNVAFTMFLALSPLRQILVQSGQIVQYGLMDPKYLASGKMVRDNAGLAATVVLKQAKASNKTWNSTGKALGYKEGELKAISDGLDKSGLMAGVNLNELLHANAVTMHNSFIRKPVDISKKLGFEAGEKINLANSFMFARERWIKANPDKVWDDTGNLEKIAFDARELSYSMTRPGKFGYQGHPDSLFSDFASVATQFLSVGHKAIEQMTFGKTLSKAEKTKLIAGNLALFGAASFPYLEDLVDAAKPEMQERFELTDDEWTFIKGGFLDYGLNNAIRQMTGDETTLQFAENFAPAGGGMLPFAILGQEFWDQSLAEAIQAVPAVSASSKILTAMSQASLVATDPVGDWGSKEFVESLFNTASGLSNYYKYRVMMETGKATSSMGNETVAVTEAEARGKLFGFSSQAEQDLYKSLKDIRKVEKQVREDTDWYYDNYKAILRRTEGDVSQRDMLVEQHRRFWAAYPDKSDRDVVMDQLKRRNQQDMNTAQESLTYLIVKQAGLGGDFLEQAEKEVINNKAITKEKREALLEFFNSARGRE